MKTSLFPKLCLLLFVTAATAGLTWADEGPLGSMTAADFKAANAKAAEQLKGLKTDSTPLSEKDKALFKQIVDGSSLQAAMSAMAPEKATSEAVKLMAKGEIEEQAGLMAKLQEIATAKGLAVTPDMADSKQKMLLILSEKKGADFDQGYILTCAVKGHQTLQETVEKVRADAADPVLKDLAANVLPLIKLHLRISLEMAKPYNDVVLTPSNPPSPAPDAKPVPAGKQEGRFKTQ